MNWPQRIIDSLGREPQIGDWYAQCCIEDLEQVDSECLETLREFLEDEDGLDLNGGRFWKSYLAALMDLDESDSFKDWMSDQSR